ncbi:hypothetical protein ACFSUK_33990 [Sphingobium scionense]|uniref:Uncharacterized protein n=1 Tax=Sphingobium scionense TaxID=1404341 RepID=A0A7W6PYP0_9SPHN|nr:MULTISPECIES: hypothetical protein [Sphingomonadaceae]MDX3901825.1 hypothetical protein [Sphingobium sp.]MEA3390351.1 hypothetical protein [Pseudomonadota bacterium]AGH51498.1 hypothetical protein G432_18900 [Sphingomonas sp. MM-1]MBB4150180.1 hypothetical protein [Sphingobium scionense]WOF43351.1 hypothetical protein KNJ79_20005 [Sphingopyxis indica]
MSTSLKTVSAYAWSLARSLMVNIIVFRTEAGLFSAMPASEWDGDSASIVREFDPFAW